MKRRGSIIILFIDDVIRIVMTATDSIITSLLTDNRALASLFTTEWVGLLSRRCWAFIRCSFQLVVANSTTQARVRESLFTFHHTLSSRSV